MDKIENLLSAFHSGGDKFAVLGQIEDLVDERATAFLVGVLRDTSEDELVRVEILKLLPHRKDRKASENHFGDAVMLILRNNADDELVRQYAAIAMRRFVECDGAIELLENVVRDESENFDVRYNALSAIEDNALLQPCRNALSRLTSVPELGRSAERTLRRFS